MQNWYCEHEDCGECINEGRSQCAGCQGWFCAKHVQTFSGPLFWVCLTCRSIWCRLHEAEQEAFCPLCGRVRDDRERRLCEGCDWLMGEREPDDGSWLDD
jgi:hypothetical protein